MNIIEMVLVAGGLAMLLFLVGGALKTLLENPYIIVVMAIILIPMWLIIYIGSRLHEIAFEGFEYNPEITLLNVKEWEKAGYEVRSHAGNRGAPIFFYTKKTAKPSSDK
jgi:hypothetical protein